MTNLDAKVAEVLGKYQKQDSPVRSARAFDTASARATTRAGARPGVAQTKELTLGDEYAAIAAIEDAMIEYAEQRGKLQADFTSILGKDAYMNLGEFVKYHVVSSILQQKAKGKEIKRGALKRKGDSLELLVNKIAEVITEGHQKTIEARDRLAGIQQEAIAHMKYLDNKIIEYFDSGLDFGEDHFVLMEEMKKLKTEYQEVESIVAEVEGEIEVEKARAKTGSGDYETVKGLYGKLRELAKVKEGLLDGTYMAEGAEREARREILDKAEGLQSAKGALAVTRATYQQLNVLRDAYDKTEIKYRHAKSDLVPTFLMQAQAAAYGKGIKELKDSLVEAGNLSMALLEASESMIMKIGTEVQEFLQTPTYDPVKAAESERRIENFMSELIDIDMQWAESQQSIQDVRSQIGGQNIHYAMHQ